MSFKLARSDIFSTAGKESSMVVISSNNNNTSRCPLDVPIKGLSRGRKAWIKGNGSEMG